MSQAAERLRLMTLKRQADAAAARAGALGAALERIWGGDDEPPPQLVAAFEGACAEAERLLLEYSLGGPMAAEPFDVVVEGDDGYSNTGKASSSEMGEAE